MLGERSIDDLSDVIYKKYDKRFPMGEVLTHLHDEGLITINDNQVVIPTKKR